jgi:RNA polymerase sigma-70 factor (ECF subfamily)
MMIRNGRFDRNERFRRLYQKYYWRVVKFYVRAFRCSQEDAEELAQEAFLRFYEAIDEYRGDAEWAFFERIARHIAYNRIRAGKTQKRNVEIVEIDAPEFTHELAAPDEPDYAVREQNAQRIKRLCDAISNLSEGQRQCLQLWLRDLSYTEIATALRISLDAVKSRLRDAKRELRERLGDEGKLPEDEQ